MLVFTEYNLSIGAEAVPSSCATLVVIRPPLAIPVSSGPPATVASSAGVEAVPAVPSPDQGWSVQRIRLVCYIDSGVLHRVPHRGGYQGGRGLHNDFLKADMSVLFDNVREYNMQRRLLLKTRKLLCRNLLLQL